MSTVRPQWIVFGTTSVPPRPPDARRATRDNARLTTPAGKTETDSPRHAGDSIKQQGSSPANGWVSILQDKYARKVDIVNRGYSGYNTRVAKLILPHLVPRVVDDDSVDGAPTLCTIFFGANDAALPDRTSGKQHVSLEVYVNNLRSMVTYLRKEAGVRRVVLIAPPPVSEAHRVVHAKEKYGVDLVLGSERTVEMTGKYAAACKGLAAELGVPCVDLWSRFVGVEGYGDRLLNDGLHLTAEGNGLVAEAVLEVLKGLKLDAEEMAADMPSWDAMLLEGGEGLSEAVLEDAANKVLREHLKGTGRWNAANDWSGSRRFDDFMKALQ